MKKELSMILLFLVTLLITTGCSLNSNRIKLEDISGTWKRDTIYGKETYIFSNDEFIYSRTSQDGSYDINLEYKYNLIYGESGNTYVELSNCNSDIDDKYCPMFGENIPIDIINEKLTFTGDLIISLEKQ